MALNETDDADAFAPNLERLRSEYKDYPREDDRPADEILAYDEAGLPT